MGASNILTQKIKKAKLQGVNLPSTFLGEVPRVKVFSSPRGRGPKGEVAPLAQQLYQTPSSLSLIPNRQSPLSLWERGWG